MYVWRQGKIAELFYNYLSATSHWHKDTICLTIFFMSLKSCQKTNTCDLGTTPRLMLS